MKSVKFSVPEEEFAVYQREADRVGLPLIEWVRARLRGDVRAAPAVLDEAFRRIDVSDAMRELTGDPPEPRIPKATEVAAKISLLGKPQKTDHACLHHAELLRADGGPSLVCGHSTQVGRPCHWPSNRSPDCLLFTPRRRA